MLEKLNNHQGQLTETTKKRGRKAYAKTSANAVLSGEKFDTVDTLRSLAAGTFVEVSAVALKKEIRSMPRGPVTILFAYCEEDEEIFEVNIWGEAPEMRGFPFKVSLHFHTLQGRVKVYGGKALYCGVVDDSDFANPINVGW